MVSNNGQMVKDKTNKMWILAKALKNMEDDKGNKIYPYWPTVQMINATNHAGAAEDMIVSCTVTDGLGYAQETFPISVVNYDITNYPPYMNKIEDQVVYINEPWTYQINAYDPDQEDMLAGLCYEIRIYSMLLPGAANIIWVPYDPASGTIHFVPSPTTYYSCIVKVRDSRGAYTIGSFKMICKTRDETDDSHQSPLIPTIEVGILVHHGVNLSPVTNSLTLYFTARK